MVSSFKFGVRNMFLRDIRHHMFYQLCPLNHSKSPPGHCLHCLFSRYLCSHCYPFPLCDLRFRVLVDFGLMLIGDPALCCLLCEHHVYRQLLIINYHRRVKSHHITIVVIWYFIIAIIVEDVFVVAN